MQPEVQNIEYTYAVTLETPLGQSIVVPFASLTREEVASFLQVDFKRLVDHAGVKGARVQVEHASTIGYDRVLEETEACLRRTAMKAA